MFEHKLDHPSKLTPEAHKKVLTNLRSVLEQLKAASPNGHSVNSIKIRNWLFILEEGVPTVDIYLEKIPLNQPVEVGSHTQQDGNHFLAQSKDKIVSFEDCSFVHNFFLSSDVFDAFADHVDVRFGSLGLEPCLYDESDFRGALNNVVKLETWEPIDNRKKYTMILVDIFLKEGNSVAVLAEGAHTFEIPLDNIKSAFVLPFHPNSSTGKQTKAKSRKR